MEKELLKQEKRKTRDEEEEESEMNFLFLSLHYRHRLTRGSCSWYKNKPHLTALLNLFVKQKQDI